MSSKGESLFFIYTLSASAAVVAEAATYPLDLTKTRLQIQGEKSHHVDPGHSHAHTAKHRGMVSTAVGIVKEEGMLRLWQGVSPALLRQVVYSGSRMTFYEMIRENILKKNPDGTFAVWKSFLCGVTAGSLGQLVASPTDLVKVQMQMEGRRRLEGKIPRVHGMGHAFRKILLEGGVRGLWSGWVPNVQRAALVNMGDLMTYDTVKHQLLKRTSLKDNYIVHTAASLCSGLMAALMGTPADVVKTRVMNQPTKDGKGLLYSGSVDCLVKTVREEGFLALYKGLIPIWARMAPWSLTFWLCYENIRKLSGTVSF